MTLRALSLLAWSGLLGLQPLWYLAWAPSGVVPPAWAAALMSLPLLPVLVGLLRDRWRAYIWGVYVGLFYFIHGVVVVMTNPDARWPGVVETTLTALFFMVTVLYLRRNRTRPESPAPDERGW